MADITATAAADVGVRDLLRIPDFRRLYLAQAISDIGDGMTYLALFLLVLDLTGSTAAIALMSILVALPPVTVGLFAGAYADRHDRRRIMLVSDTLRAVVVLGMVLVGPRGGDPRAVRARLPPGGRRHVLLPARMAMLPRVVPAGGPARRQLAEPGDADGRGRHRRRHHRRSSPRSPARSWPVLIVDAATFLVSVVLVLGVSRDAGLPSAAAAASAKAIGHRRRGRSTACGSSPAPGRSSPRSPAISVTMLGLGAINVLFIPFLVNDLGASPAWAGPLEAAQTISMILAGGRRGEPRDRASASRACSSAGIAGLAVCVGPAGRRARAVGAAPDHVRGRLVRDAGPGHDDDARPAGHGRHDPRPRGRRPQRRDPDGLDRLDGRGRASSRRSSGSARCSPSAPRSRSWRRSSPRSCSAARPSPARAGGGRHAGRPAARLSLAPIRESRGAGRVTGASCVPTGCAALPRGRRTAQLPARQSPIVVLSWPMTER